MPTYIQPIKEPLPPGVFGRLIAESADEVSALLEAGKKHEGTCEDFIRQESGRLFPVEPQTTGDQPEVDIEVLAIAVLVKNPGLTVKQIADTVGCHRGTLYRKPKFQMYLKAAQSVGDQCRNELPRGQRDGETGDIEVWDSASEGTDADLDV